MMAEALEARGLSWQVLPRNASPDDDPRVLRLLQRGLPAGLQAVDAQDLPAGRLGRRRAGRRRLRASTACSSRTAARPASRRVAGANGEIVELTRRGADRRRRGGRARVAGAAAALRLGGPAAGKYLRLHPTYFVGGVYDEVVNAWDGQFQALVSFDFAARRRRLGLPRRVGQREPAVLGERAAVHRRRRAQGADAAPAQRRLLARGHPRPRARARSCSATTASRSCAGSSTTRSTGAVAARAHVELARLHHARGARARSSPSTGTTTRGAGRRLRRATSRGSSGVRTSARAYSAHQMGSCRLGRRSGDVGRRRRGRAARRRRASGSATPRRCRRRRASTRC